MKTKVLSLVTLFMLSVVTVFAAEKTETFEVKGGDCEECKTHIETTTTGVEGVTSAVWDVETKELTVVFDDEVTTLDSIEMAIAQAGNDTPTYKAPEEAYSALPECCQYEKEE
ncbi:ATPase [Maribellus comscasis]|uniref:ATPase n=1 Tax=Maribellus comscasis TaxID=2681766 RepID=A0A6I6JNK0_9BACT|nr:cation transporter [Maribellus comscasis]QGY44505.1 ATPase [Maribellus comscasis]